ncbi:uncharacterized protein LOC141708500 [Apium graveolens]|uniref:uncharacterized protein LOC141708500 n=1 Tax=Apium graveolens TaxID=4045 RepID=UPI003D7908B9
MPFPWKIKPVDFCSPIGPAFLRAPVLKSRLKKLLERPFANVLRRSGPDRAAVMDDSDELDPSSVCFGNMIRSYIEEGYDNQQKKCSRIQCNCNIDTNSDDQLDSDLPKNCENLKDLVMCSSVSERNLLADTAKILEENKLLKCKQAKISVTEALIALGYNASICESRWEKAPTYPAGVYDYVEVIKDAERLIVDIDFRAEFEIARLGCTKKYNAILQMLPEIFVGKADRLVKIIDIVSDAAKESLKDNRMAFPPWRRADYVKSKWLSPYTRTVPAPQQQQQSVTPPPLTIMDSTDLASDIKNLVIQTEKTAASSVIAGVRSPAFSDHSDTVVFSMSEDEEAE